MGATVGVLEGRIGVHEAAKLLGVSTHFIYRKSATGELATYKLGKKLTFLPSDLELFLAASKRGGEGGGKKRSRGK